MTSAITQSFPPGPRLIDGSDLNTLAAQMNAALATLGAYPVATAFNTTGIGTITAAGIIGGVLSRTGVVSGTAFTDTTGTAAAIISALGSNIAIGASWLWFYENKTNANATLAAGSGVTLSGNVITPILKWSAYLVTKTSASAVTMAYVGSGDLAPLPVSKFAAESGQGVTITASGLTGAQITTLNLTGATPANMNFPKSSTWTAATPNAQAGMSYVLMIRNTATTTTQLTVNDGVTITGNSKIQTLTVQSYNVDIISLGTVTITGIGVQTT